MVEDGELTEITQPEQANGLEYVKDFLGGNRKTHPAAWAAADPFALAKRYRAGAHATPFLLIGADHLGGLWAKAGIEPILKVMTEN